MKLLMVTPWYSPFPGGSEIMVEQISVKLNEMGIPTDVMTFMRDRTGNPIWRRKIEKMNGVTVIKIPSALSPTRFIPVQTRFIPGRFTNLLKNYDIIHFHNDADLSFLVFSYFVDKPKIFHCHCLGVTYNLYRRNFMSRFIFRSTADIYIAPSKHVMELLVNLGTNETKIKLLPNAVDVNLFRPHRQSKKENLLLFVGRLDPVKGLHFLLRSLRYLETHVELVIIGPLAWDCAYNRRILMLIKDVREKTVHKVMYLGEQETKEIIKWYNKASIFVLPSLFESLGIVNLEALSCATPVVASNVGGIPEVVQNQKNGILVPPGDVVKLAQSIQYLLDNAEIRKKFGEEGRRWVVENFSSEIITKRLLQIYEETISR